LTIPIQLLRATGVPIPEESKVDRKANIMAREMRVCLWNKLRGDFVGNTLVFGADWTETWEDRWTFNSSNHGDNGSSSSINSSKSAKNTDFVLRFTDLNP
jgi:hypothetical protein